MKKIPICGDLHMSEKRKKKKENPAVWNTGKKVLKYNKYIIHDGVKAAWSEIDKAGGKVRILENKSR